MTRALGFLTGVCLTVAVFVLVLDRWQHAPADEASLAAVIADVEPVDAVADATVAVSVAVEDEPEPVDAQAPGDAPAAAATKAAEPAATDRVDIDAVIPPLLPPGIIDGEQPVASVAPPSPEPRAPDASPTTVVEEVADSPADNTADTAPAEDVRVDSSDPGMSLTHIFWSPFRSEWAAKGFARRLTNATQIPIEVVEAGSGKYRVSFDYQDESQRLEHIERIESITGLQLE